jgi:threonine/homoserine/homoserine lactone efflux protein
VVLDGDLAAVARVVVRRREAAGLRAALGLRAPDVVVVVLVVLSGILRINPSVLTILQLSLGPLRRAYPTNTCL